MNNNNRGNSNSNNNRRRGRGNNTNRPQGGAPLNRIDSRARGNAPQLLEKYRKLAQDAHLNGDRVTAEYYLQFADHYFRVLADSRVRQEEQRRPQGERWQEGDAPPREEQDDSGEYMESDFPSFDQPPAYVHTRREREERPERPERQDRPERSERPERNGERPRRDERPAPAERSEFESSADEAPEAPVTTSDDGDERSAYEPAENPFVRERQPSTRGLRPRRALREPQDGRDRPRRDEGEDDGGNGGGFDASILPPPITLSPADAMADDEPAAPKRRGRPRKPAADAGEALEVVSRD